MNIEVVKLKYSICVHIKEHFAQKDRISEKTNSDNDDDECFFQNHDTESEFVESSEGDEQSCHERP